MLMSIRGLAASVIIVVPAFFANSAHAETETDPPGAVEVSGNVAITSDYRFRGVSLSGGDLAIQGGFDVDHESGFYAGTWASSIDDGGTDVLGDVELDLYGGWSGDIVEGAGLDIGLIYYLYPTEDMGRDTDYFEAYGKLSGTIGPAEAEFGVAYAWDQNALGGDNLYLSGDLSSGVPGTPLTLSGHIGYTNGVLAPPIIGGSTDDSGFDYNIGASFSLPHNLEFSLAYSGVDGPPVDGLTDDTVVVTLSMSF